MRYLFSLLTASLTLLSAVILTPATPANAATPASCTGIDVHPTDDLRAMVNRAPSGSTFCIKPGVHRLSGLVVAKNGNRFIGEPGAILNGSKVLNSFTKQGNFWVAGGQTQQEGGPSSGCEPDKFTGGAYTACTFGDKVFINNHDLWQVGALSDLPPGATDRFYFDYANDRIYLASDPSGKLVEATNGHGGLKGFAGTNQNDVLVEGLIFEKFGIDASGEAPIKTGERWTVRNNEVRLSSGSGIRAGTGAQIIGNSIHHMGRYGIFGFGPDILVQNNTLAYNEVDGHESGDSGATKFIKSTGARFIGNHVHHNYGNGLWSDADNADTVYEGNYVHDNEGVGIFHEISCSGTIRNNTLAGNAAGNNRSLYYGADILLNGTKDTVISGNDIAAGSHGIALVSTKRGTSPNERNEPDCANFNYEIKNVSVHDNTVRLKTGKQVGLVGAHDRIWTTNNNRFARNNYFLEDIDGAHFAWKGSLLNRTQWLATGQDTGATFTAGLGVQPKPDIGQLPIAAAATTPTPPAALDQQPSPADTASGANLPLTLPQTGPLATLATVLITLLLAWTAYRYRNSRQHLFQALRRPSPDPRKK